MRLSRKRKVGEGGEDGDQPGVSDIGVGSDIMEDEVDHQIKSNQNIIIKLEGQEMDDTATKKSLTLQ